MEGMEGLGLGFGNLEAEGRGRSSAKSEEMEKSGREYRPYFLPFIRFCNVEYASSSSFVGRHSGPW